MFLFMIFGRLSVHHTLLLKVFCHWSAFLNMSVVQKKSCVIVKVSQFLSGSVMDNAGICFTCFSQFQCVNRVQNSAALFKRVFTQSLADPSRVIIAKRLCWQARDWLPVWVAQLLTSIQFLSTIIKMSSLSCVMLFAEQCMNLPPKLQSFHVCAREVA